MYTAADLENQSEQHLKAVFSGMAETLYGKGWRAPLAQDIGMSVDGIANWMRKGHRPSSLAILYLLERVKRQEAEKTLSDLSKVMKKLQEYG